MNIFKSFVLLLFFSPIVSFGQNLLTNTSFENGTAGKPDDIVQFDDHCFEWNAFLKFKTPPEPTTPDWSLYNTISNDYNQKGDHPTITFPSVNAYDGDKYVGIVGGEGITQTNINVNNGDYVFGSFLYRNFYPNTEIGDKDLFIILSKKRPVFKNNLYDLKDGLGQKILYLKDVKISPQETGWNLMTFGHIQADDDYDWFGIYIGEESTDYLTWPFEHFLIDEVFLGKSCANLAPCLENITYQNTNSLPSLTRRDDYIKAKNNTSVVAYQDITFQAGNYVALEPGFTVEAGGAFTAKIAPCDEKSLSIIHTPTGCTSKLCALFANSYNYSLSWSHSLGNAHEVEVSPTTTTTYTVTATDNITN